MYLVYLSRYKIHREGTDSRDHVCTEAKLKLLINHTGIATIE